MKANELVTLNCMVCNTEFKGKEPEMCCSGSDCGCMGMPIDPVVCSIECYYNLPMYTHISEEERSKLISDCKVLNNIAE